MIAQCIISKVAEQVAKEKEANIWGDSAWKDIATLENNNVGIVGEQVIQQLCVDADIEANIDGSKTKEIGGGVGDGTIKKKSVEIKCARQGTGNAASFQHELGEKPWLADYILFLDISPFNFYLTLFPNMTEEKYKLKGFKCPYFPTRGITWRKADVDKDGNKIGGGAFKFDTSVNLNTTQSKVTNPHTFIWSPTTTIQEVADFINRIIN